MNFVLYMYVYLFNITKMSKKKSSSFESKNNYTCNFACKN